MKPGGPASQSGWRRDHLWVWAFLEALAFQDLENVLGCVSGEVHSVLLTPRRSGGGAGPCSLPDFAVLISHPIRTQTSSGPGPGTARTQQLPTLLECSCEC